MTSSTSTFSISYTLAKFPPSCNCSHKISSSFDLHSKIPFHSLTPEKQLEYWDDGLHLTAAGYDWMGDHIADALIPLIKQDRRISLKKTIITPPIPPRISGDDRPLEEEIGDPRDIHSGYVVVRKRDLD